MVSELAGIVTRVLILLLLAVAAVFAALEAWNSVTHYRTPYTFRQDLAAGTPLTERVVLIILDGIRLDASRQMAHLQELAGRGASGVVRTGAPSLSHPSRAVMVTGAWQEVNGVTNNSLFEPPPVDSLFSAAKRMAVPVAVAGSHFWENAFGEHLDPAWAQLHGQKLHFGASPEELIDWNEEMCRQDLAFLSRQPDGLLIVGLTAADSAAHDYGGRSEQYLLVAAAVDSCVSQFVKALDDGRTTFVVTSDHGHINAQSLLDPLFGLGGHGGHGGLEEEVVNVPLILAGRAIRPGDGWHAEQVDIAPTISALLGLPLPATNQGGVLWDALDVPAEVEPELRDREREQRELADSVFPNREQVRSDERRTRSLRALAMFTTIWFLACGVVLGYRDSWKPLIVAVGLYYLVYYGFFFALGMRYSLSVINRQEYLLSFFGKDLGAAVAAFCIGALFLVSTVKSPGSRLILDFALLVVFSLGIQVTWVYFDSGLFMEAMMLDLRSAFKAYLDLLQVTAIGAVAPVFGLLYAIGSRRGKKRPKPSR